MNYREFWKKYRINFLGFAIGVFGGYLYWNNIGCLSGACPLKQLWYYDGLLGGLFGLIIADLIKSLIEKRRKK